MSDDEYWPVILYDGDGNFLEIQKDGRMEWNGKLVTDDIKLREYLMLYAKGQAQ